MAIYDIKRGHYKNIEGEALGSIIQETFGNCKTDGDFLISTYGALDRLEVRPIDKKTVEVRTIMNKGVDNDTAADTVKHYNEFLFKLTGMTSKERQKKLQKKVKAGK